MWAWAAAVLPISCLAALFFTWSFGTDKLFEQMLVIGATLMFAVAVTWWWWAIYVIRRLVSQWDNTKTHVVEVLTEIKEVRTIVEETFKGIEDK